MKFIILLLMLSAAPAWALPIGNYKEICYSNKGLCAISYEGVNRVRSLLIPETLFNSIPAIRAEMSGNGIEIKPITAALQAELAKMPMAREFRDLNEDSRLISSMSPEADRNIDAKVRRS